MLSCCNTSDPGTVLNPGQPAVIRSSSPHSYQVPFGHFPYSPSLPAAMGPIWDFPMEWRYYVGWAHDRSGSKHFTILVEILRSLLNDSHLAVILQGIGTPGPSNQNFSSQLSVAEGTFPTPTSTSWSIDATSTFGMKMTSVLTSGILGLSGATYKVDLTDEEHSVSASFMLKDTFGMILEGASSSKSSSEFQKPSYEFAMPSLTITEGTITMDGETTELGGGNLWLDRQTLAPVSPPNTEASLLAHTGRLSSQLYIGNWLGVVMNDHVVYVLIFFWPKHQPQWIVGSELQHPVYPTRKVGLKYLPLPNWDHASPVQGVHVLDDGEFDLNILLPDDPSKSPHWTSPTSHQTYCSAWRLRIGSQVYGMQALVPGSEVNMVVNFFFEGAATICYDMSHEVGHAFVEQMGYTQ